jgi:hypothetical protein
MQNLRVHALLFLFLLSGIIAGVNRATMPHDLSVHGKLPQASSVDNSGYKE